MRDLTGDLYASGNPSRFPPATVAPGMPGAVWLLWFDPLSRCRHYLLVGIYTGKAAADKAAAADPFNRYQVEEARTYDIFDPCQLESYWGDR